MSGVSQSEKREDTSPRSGREELFEGPIQEELEDLRQQEKQMGGRRRQVSCLALVVAGGMVLSILIRFILGL